MKRILVLMCLIILALAGCTQEPVEQSVSHSYLTSSDLAQYDLYLRECSDSYCFYTHNNYSLAISVQTFQSLEDAKGSFEYSSSHLIHSDWVIYEDDTTKLLRWNESDTVYIHSWVVDELRLIHVTSAGSPKAQSVVTNVTELLVGMPIFE